MISIKIINIKVTQNLGLQLLARLIRNVITLSVQILSCKADVKRNSIPVNKVFSNESDSITDDKIRRTVT